MTRGGASYSFPSIEAQLNPTAERPVQVSEVNFVNVGADLVRVLLHEKAAWCWYSCGFAEEEPGRPVLATAQPARLRLIVTGPAALMEDQGPYSFAPTTRRADSKTAGATAAGLCDK